MPDTSDHVASAAGIGKRIPRMETGPVPDLVVAVASTNAVRLARLACANMRVPEVGHFARTTAAAAAARSGRGWRPGARVP